MAFEDEGRSTQHEGDLGGGKWLGAFVSGEDVVLVFNAQHLGQLPGDNHVAVLFRPNRQKTLDRIGTALACQDGRDRSRIPPARQMRPQIRVHFRTPANTPSKPLADVVERQLVDGSALDRREVVRLHRRFHWFRNVARRILENCQSIPGAQPANAREGRRSAHDHRCANRPTQGFAVDFVAVGEARTERGDERRAVADGEEALRVEIEAGVVAAEVGERGDDGAAAGILRHAADAERAADVFIDPLGAELVQRPRDLLHHVAASRDSLKRRHARQGEEPVFGYAVGLFHVPQGCGARHAQTPDPVGLPMAQDPIR